ncbi:MAG: D-inositol-3-phosphate glycosyltransferase [Methanonatronarchaeales archaeon]|nr:D-inositol-3-phosphate glycosyltransferase [Methanonatronarchaeales archaeon]
MRIAYVYDAVYPWVKGGVERRVWELASRLAGEHDVHVFGMKYWDGPDVVEREGVTLHGVCKPVELYAGGRRSIPPAVYFAARVAPPLLREEFDVVDCQEFPYFPVFSARLHASLGRSRLVVTWHELWGDYWYKYLGWRGFFGKAVERLALRAPGTVVAVSERVRRDLAGLGRTDVDVVPNGVDLAEVESARALGEVDVVYVGRLAEHKNVDLLLGALSEVAGERGVSCRLVGGGPERERLERLAGELGVSGSVEFVGFVEDHSEVLGHLKAARVFVSASTREGFGMSVLEAGACGAVPVVMDHPDNAATELVVDGETGFLTEPSSEAIADRLRLLLSNEGTRKEMSAAAVNFAGGFDWGGVADDVLGVYAEAARG